MKEYERVEVASRQALRDWLAANHEQREPIWLVSYKKAAGSRYVPYAAIVEEALCFGWIDSLPRKLDAERSMLLLAPRKAGSTWSAANRSRVEALTAQGLMRPPGLAAVERAKADGSWDLLKNAETGIAPTDLARALEKAGATKGWDAFSLAVRKRCIEYLDAAKRPGTRSDRVAKIMAGAKAGADPLDWRAAQAKRRE